MTAQQTNSITSRYWLILVPVLFVLAMLSVLFLFNDTQESSENTPQMGGDFELQSASGPVSLTDYRGKVVIIYFGYTFCPDVCPTSLALLTLALDTLTDEELKQIQPIFISVDPERDTPERMKKYLTNFDPEIIGLTGSREELESVWSSYGVYEAKLEGESEENYLVDHSSRTYVIDAECNLLLTYLFGTENKVITEDVRHLVTRQ